MRALLINSKFWPEYSGPGVRALNTYSYLKKDMSIQVDTLCGSTVFNSNKSYTLKSLQAFRIKNYQNFIKMGYYYLRHKVYEHYFNFFESKFL